MSSTSTNLYPYHFTPEKKFLKLKTNPSDPPLSYPVIYLNSYIVSVEYTGNAYVICDNCVSLKTINSSNAHHISCDDCPLLETINAEMADSIEVYDCANLKYINCSKSLKYLRIKNCPLLETIPDIDNIDQVRIDDCPMLHHNGFWNC
jgi:hypothetical protein